MPSDPETPRQLSDVDATRAPVLMMNLDTRRQMDALHQLVDVLMTEGKCLEARYFWHQTNDPYVKFLAEFFLRRSNRSTVARNLPAFIARFPTADMLIRADRNTLLAAARWAGMRGRTASLPGTMARFVERAHWTSRELVELPYIGEYAAKGIALYVFGEPVFPIDNNVLRVIGRFLGFTELREIERSAEGLMSIALELGGVTALRSVHMGTLSLGWEYCRSRNPRCEACPLSVGCIAWSRDDRFNVVS